MRPQTTPTTFADLPTAPKGSSPEAGTTMLETALIIGLLLSVVLFIVEYSQYMFTRNMVEEAVYRAGKRVAVVPNLDIDYRRLESSHPRYRRAVHARRMAIETGEALLNEVLASDLQEGEKLPYVTYLRQDFPGRDGAAQTIQSPIAILLAGECATRTDGTQAGTQVCNTKPVGGDDSPNFPPFTATLEYLASEFPIRVVIDVERSSILSMLPTQKFQVQTYVYREAIPEGPFSEAIEESIGNPPVTAQVPLDLPVFGSPAKKAQPNPNWEVCGMTEAQMAAALIECSVRERGPCFYPPDECQAQRK